MNAEPYAITAASRVNTAQQAGDLRLMKKCREFESLLYASMLHAMRKTIEKSELFYGGHAEDIYTSLLDDEYAKIMADHSQQGIADALYQQLKKPPAVSMRGVNKGETDYDQTHRAARDRQGG